jgi:hypothetical protein
MSEREGKAALFGPAPRHAPGATAEGRRAVFSGPRRRRGDVLVECDGCGAYTPVPLVEMPVRLLPSLWAPWRKFSRLMRCPECSRATWCRIHWRAAFD